MLLKEIIEAFELIDDPQASGEKVADRLKKIDFRARIEVKTVKGDKGSTDFIKMVVPGSDGRSKGGDAPTLGIIGRLGGVGARPERIGAVSDADGTIVAIAVGLKLIEMQRKGDLL